MKFELPKLPYAYNALEPVISEKTISFHYGKHHQTYVNNTNNLIVATEFENADLETIIKKASGALFNNAAQVWNHNFYFLALTPDKGTKPSDKLLKAIESGWGSLDNFKTEFNKLAIALFGSGWTWLVKDKGWQTRNCQ